MSQPNSAVGFPYQLVEAVVYRVPKVRFVYRPLIEVNAKYVLIEGGPPTAPNMGSKGCSRRTGPRKEQVSMLD